MNRRTVIQLSTTCLVICCSCSRTDRPFDAPVEKEHAFFFGITNVRGIFKGSLSAHAYFSKAKYTTFSLGTSTIPYSGTPPVFVELHDGTVLDLTASDVVSLLIGKATAREPWKCDKWPDGTERLYFHPCQFFIRDNLFLGMHVTYDPEAYDYAVAENGTKRKIPRYNIPAPKIGTSKETLRPMPYDAHDFLEVFGQPDRVVDSFSE